jgi:hypothetical protein
VLIDQQNPNILPLTCEILEGFLDRRVVCLAIHYQEVLLVVWRRCDVLFEHEHICRIAL